MAYQMLETTQTNKMEEVFNKANSDLNGSQEVQNFCLDDKDVQKKREKIKLEQIDRLIHVLKY